MEASVKGSLVLGVVVTVRRHRKQGRIAAPQLEARLSGPALELIDQKIDIGRWYPMSVFSELIELDWDVGGRRDPGYMIEEGALAANRLFDSGIYQQLHYADRAGQAQTRESLTRQAKLITTITANLYNFLEFEVKLDPARSEFIEILYRNARPFSEALRYTTEGFMNQINARQGSSRRWTSVRTRPDQVAFRMALPERLKSAS